MSNEAEPAIASRGREWQQLAMQSITSGAPAHAGDLFAQSVATETGIPLIFVVAASGRSAGQSLEQRVDELAAVWKLTPRQAETLAALTSGRSNKEIATSLRVSVRTIEIHVSSVLRKAACTSRSELLARLWAGPTRT